MQGRLLSVTIVTFNNEDNIKRCLDSLLNQKLNLEIIIVDNNSSDRTTEIISKYKDIKLLKQDENLGFSKGHNLAAKKSLGEYLLILNPDTQASRDSVVKMINFMETNHEIGLIGPKLIESDNSVQASVRRLPTFWRAFEEYVLRKQNSYVEYIPQGDSPTEVEAVYGAVMLLKKDLFKQIGGFDERFFLYYEDLDLCRKIAKKGLKVIYFPKSEFLHHKGFSTKKIKSVNLPAGFRTLANFVPIKGSGSLYYQVESGIIYHGFLAAFLIRLLIYFFKRIPEKLRD